MRDSYISAYHCRHRAGSVTSWFPNWDDVTKSNFCILSHPIMVGRPLSVALKKQLAHQEYDALMSEAVNEIQKSVMSGMQATTVLQHSYVQRVQGQLEADEEWRKKTKKSGKLNMDGRPKLLTQDEIFQGVEDWHKAREEEVEAGLKKKEVKAKYDATCEAWKQIRSTTEGLKQCSGGRVATRCREMAAGAGECKV